jgi:hypothetical protein
VNEEGYGKMKETQEGFGKPGSEDRPGDRADQGCSFWSLRY